MSELGVETVGMAMIVRDEADNIEQCLDSFWDDVDQVAILDTGSEDGTVDVVQAYAKAKNDGKLRLGHFEWISDFAAARTAAEALLDESIAWRSWCDADDIISGAQNLRALAAQAPPELSAYIAGYDYAQGPGGECLCYLKRERLVRAGAGEWHGRVHEAQVIAGAATQIPPDVVEWVHRKHVETPDAAIASNTRNLKILRGWVKDEPENPRILAYLGTENAVRGKHKTALRFYRKYLRLKTGWDEERAQIHRKLSASLLATGDPAGAERSALTALTVMPQWPDSYLTLAQTALIAGQFEKAIPWAHRVLELGAPETLLIINPLDYTFEPHHLLAHAHAELRQLDQATHHAKAALALLPGHPVLQPAYMRWRADQKREATAQTVVRLAQLLVEHDEQLKALTMLQECVPYFAQDHHQVVSARSELRERVEPLLDPEGQAEHYEEATELGIPDLAVVEHLPRAHFLLAGLREQQAEAA